MDEIVVRKINKKKRVQKAEKESLILRKLRLHILHNPNDTATFLEIKPKIADIEKEVVKIYEKHNLTECDIKWNKI